MRCGMDICVVLGSKSDMPIAEKCRGVLEKFNVSYQIRVASAHRAPKYLEGIIEKAEADGCQVFIGMAGVAAALPGVIASVTMPVIGVPVGGKVPLTRSIYRSNAAGNACGNCRVTMEIMGALCTNSCYLNDSCALCRLWVGYDCKSRFR